MYQRIGADDLILEVRGFIAIALLYPEFSAIVPKGQRSGCVAVPENL
jgi:hypothetical protein